MYTKQSSTYPLINSSKVTKNNLFNVSIQAAKYKMENNFQGEMPLTQDVYKQSQFRPIHCRSPHKITTLL